MGLLFFVLVLGEVDGVQFERSQRSRRSRSGCRRRRQGVFSFGRVAILLRARYGDVLCGQGLSCGHYNRPRGLS